MYNNLNTYIHGHSSKILGLKSHSCTIQLNNVSSYLLSSLLSHKHTKHNTFSLSTPRPKKTSPKKIIHPSIHSNPPSLLIDSKKTLDFFLKVE